MLFEYNIKIVYRPDSQNVKTDALIRMTESKPSSLNDERVRQQYQTILTPDRLKLDGTEYVINAIDDLIYYRVVIVNKDNEECSEIRDAIIEGKEKLNNITLVKCSVDDDILYHKDRLWVPQQMYTDLIIEIHDQPAYDHSGVNRTYKLLRREYYWRDMKNTVTTYIRNCYKCQRFKASRDREHDLIQPLPIPQKRWQDIFMNFIVGLSQSKEYNVIFVVVNRLTKKRYYISYTVTDEGTSAEYTAKMLVNHIFRLHGLSLSIVSNRDS